MNLLRLTLCALTSLVLASNALADPFEKGAKRTGVTVGAGSSYNENYAIIGLGAGYFVARGLELGLDAQAWLGDNNIYEITPTATYIVTQLGSFKPYAGVLYKETYAEGQDDYSAYGARAGIIIDGNSKVYTRLGLVNINYLDCTENRFVSCSETYPEAAVMFSF